MDGATLRVLRFGSRPRVAVAAHGITASAMPFAAVARHLPPDWSLYALDLRGRGGSTAAAPGPYGVDRHAADLITAARTWGAGAPIAPTGQSMGAYVALRAAALEPGLFDRLLLIDGGLPLPVPADTDPDAVLGATLGPAIARLPVTYESDEAYVDFFRAHPALGPHWSTDIEAYVRYDLTAPAGRWPAPPARLLHASRGVLGTAPGMLPPALVDHWTARAPRLSAEAVPDCSHYTILMGEPARTVAARLTSPV